MQSPQPSYRPTERANQRSKLLELLRAYEPDLAPIREVVEAAGLQYGARVLELRRRGYRILNEPGEGFRLVTVRPPTPQPEPQRSEAAEKCSDRLFPDDAPLRHKDLG